MNLPLHVSRDFLLNAIEAYSLYTDHEKALLKALIKLEEGGVALISATELVSTVKCGRSTFYRFIKAFTKEGIIDPVMRGTHIRSFKLNLDKMDSIIKHYEKKLSL